MVPHGVPCPMSHVHPMMSQASASFCARPARPGAGTKHMEPQKAAMARAKAPRRPRREKRAMIRAAEDEKRNTLKERPRTQSESISASYMGHSSWNMLECYGMLWNAFKRFKRSHAFACRTPMMGRFRMDDAALFLLLHACLGSTRTQTFD